MPTLEDVMNYLNRKGYTMKVILAILDIIMLIVISLFKSDPTVDFIGYLVFILILIMIIFLPFKGSND